MKCTLSFLVLRLPKKKMPLLEVVPRIRRNSAAGFDLRKIGEFASGG